MAGSRNPRSDRTTPWRRLARARRNLAQHWRDREAPSLTAPVSQLCTASQFAEPAYARWCEEIGEVPRSHRKQWEFVFILQTLARHGMLSPGRSGIGFGVGEEPLPALMARHGVAVIATDLAPEAAAGKGWVETAQHAASRDQLNARGICPPDDFDRLVRFRPADMTDLPTDLEPADFCWSACAFEHLGSIEAGLEFVIGSTRLLRPGGLAVHTTEFNCSSDDATLVDGPTVLFRRRDILTLQERLRRIGCRMVLNFNQGDQPIDRHIDLPPYAAENHLKLRIEQWVVTSIGLTIVKGGAA